MKPSELAEFLSYTIPAGHNVLITGEPGGGKTSIVEQACARADADLIISHPAVNDPTDAKGLPFVIKGRAVFLPFGDAEKAAKATKRTVWFLDDLGQALAAVQASYMQLMHGGRLGDYKLSEHVTFIAATNRRTDRAGVSGILEPVKSRCVSIVGLDVDLNDWCLWAIDNGIASELVAFLRFKPELLSAFSATADLTNSPTPRTWHHVAMLLDLKMPANLQHQAIIGAVGEGAAIELAAFLKIAAALPSIDQILTDPKSVPMPKQPQILYALSTALAYRATVQNFPRIAQFLQRMLDEGHGEFSVLTIRDAMRKEKAITSTPAFVRLAGGDLKPLMEGA